MAAETSGIPPSVPAPGDAAALLGGRRTVNQFDAEPPPREALRAGLEMARWAPNHHLTEPWRFYILGEATKAAVIELNRQLVAARKDEAAAEAKARSWQAVPGWVVATRVRAPSELQAWEDYAACACAIHNMALYLWSRGIGMKWTTGPVTREPGFYDALGVDPDAEAVVGLLWYGYPGETPRTRRHPVSERITELP